MEKSKEVEKPELQKKMIWLEYCGVNPDEFWDALIIFLLEWINRSDFSHTDYVRAMTNR